MTQALSELDPEEFKLTAKQEEAIALFSTEALYIMLYGGSRSTKTFTILRTIAWRAIAVPKSRHAVLRFRFNHVKASVVYDTFPKMMSLCFPDLPQLTVRGGNGWYLDKQDWYVSFPNGSEIWFGGLDDKERTEKVLGNEYATIFLNETSQISYNSYLIILTRLAQKCFYMRGGKKKELRLKLFIDENPPTKGHWTYKIFIDKIDPDSNSKLKHPEDYAVMLMNPNDNRANLPASYLKTLDGMPKRKRDRFYLGKFGEDSENALWTGETFEKCRVNEIPEGVQLVRIVVAVDPSGASDDESENNDDIGIGVAALGSDGIGYCLEDLTINAGPATWGKVVASAYERHEADRVVGESNFGGGMVEYVVRTANPDISYKAVRASRGKVVRGEPISALQETGKIKMVGKFDKLEDELCGFTTTGYIGERSPNRADWFVWAFTELFPGMTSKPEPEENLTIPNLRRL